MRQCSHCGDYGYRTADLFSCIDDGTGWRYVCPSCIPIYRHATMIRVPQYLILEVCGLPLEPNNHNFPIPA